MPPDSVVLKGNMNLIQEWRIQRAYGNDAGY